MEPLVKIAVASLAAVALVQAFAVVLVVVRALRAVREAMDLGERLSLLARSENPGEYLAAEARLAEGRKALRAVKDEKKEPARRVDPLWERRPRSPPDLPPAA